MRNYAKSAVIAKDSVCKLTSGKWPWLDLSAIGLALFFIVFGELVWLPDPLRIGHQVYWIELIDELIYILLLLPILWGLSAVKDLIKLCWRRKADLSLNTACIVLGIGRIVGLVSSIMAIFCILFAKDQYFWLVLCITIAWVMSLISIHILEWNRAIGLPKRSLSILGLTIMFLIALLWPTNYLVTYPGLTMNMNVYAHVDQGMSDDEIAGVLIFERPAFPIDWLYAKLFTQYEFAKRIPTNQTLGEQLQEVRTQQIDANEIASAVAFAKVGIGQGAVSHGARVVALTKDFPAAKQLKLGDIIIQVNGQSITTTTELINHIKQTKPGDELKLIIMRNKAAMNVIIETQADVKDPEKAVIGTQVSDEVELDLPLKVAFKPYLLHVGGPSHGAMLTLALIDQLTPGGVTYGNIVAGTGTINSLGQVGSIGGIRQKAFTVERSTTDVFFVPAEQLAEARQGAAHLNIVPVKTIDEILKWLKEHPKQ
ncbi:MAG: PDZ domain-containing protein [Paenibacillaceae bacterium]